MFLPSIPAHSSPPSPLSVSPPRLRRPPHSPPFPLTVQSYDRFLRRRPLHLRDLSSLASASQSPPTAADNETKIGIGRGANDEVNVLPSCLRRESLPRHVAIIMDGNSRWARARGLPVSAGHEAGYRSLKNVIALSCRWGIPVLTVFAFSSENWLRPKPEVDFLMMLFESVLKENIGDFLREGIRVRIIGDSSRLPQSLQKLVKEIENLTNNNQRLELIVAIGYSGRQDIVHACQKIAEKVKHGILEPADITESLIAEQLQTNSNGDFQCPDLLIRTSGELRLSNFLLWQTAYSELFFARSNWPDFVESDYVEALASYQKRQRRFGQRTI